MVTNERQRGYGLRKPRRNTGSKTYSREDGDGNGNPKEKAGVASGIQFVPGVSVKSRSLDKECANS
jgi:hypothetical protein